MSPALIHSLAASALILASSSLLAPACEGHVKGRLEAMIDFSDPAPVELSRDMARRSPHIHFGIKASKILDNGFIGNLQVWRGIVTNTYADFPIEFDLPFSFEGDCPKVMEISASSTPERFHWLENYIFSGNSIARMDEYVVIKVHPPIF